MAVYLYNATTDLSYSNGYIYLHKATPNLSNIMAVHLHKATLICPLLWLLTSVTSACVISMSIKYPHKADSVSETNDV